jgi:FMN-dependent NADH-azoreductase
MTTILQINSAARSQGAQSTLLASELTAKLQQSNPGAQVVVRDLLADALPHLDETVLGAFFTPADQRSAEQNAIVAKSDALIAELQAADIVVIAAPMYNFGVSSQLKTYFDWIARAGVTFRYRERSKASSRARRCTWSPRAAASTSVRRTTARRRSCAPSSASSA